MKFLQNVVMKISFEGSTNCLARGKEGGTTCLFIAIGGSVQQYDNFRQNFKKETRAGQAFKLAASS